MKTISFDRERYVLPFDHRGSFKAKMFGFAVGRTDFWEPLVNYRAKKITPEAAVAEIARRYRQFADIFQKSQ
jgi:myo-inositol catabolism protein IolC